jgi:hypothetical protein
VRHERLSGPVVVVDENVKSQDGLRPGTKRAVAEAIDVSLFSKGGCYEVQSASENRSLRDWRSVVSIPLGTLSTSV